MIASSESSILNTLYRKVETIQFELTLRSTLKTRHRSNTNPLGHTTLPSWVSLTHLESISFKLNSPRVLHLSTNELDSPRVLYLPINKPHSPRVLHLPRSRSNSPRVLHLPKSMPFSPRVLQLPRSRPNSPRVLHSPMSTIDSKGVHLIFEMINFP